MEACLQGTEESKTQLGPDGEKEKGMGFHPAVQGDMGVVDKPHWQ